MTKADALAPIVALEATVVAGRTYQAYKRGKGDEARERFLEEITGSIVWLWGVQVLNEVGDKIIGKLLKEPGANFDVGSDKLRRPFDNFMNKIKQKGFSPKQVAMIKGAKVVTSILLANLFIGGVVPKINHLITNSIRHNKHVKEEERNQKTVSNSGENLAFKGGAGFAALNKFTNAIENTNTGKLLSTDFGIAGGRMLNARSKEERNEIGFRDISSIYFYMWAQGHVGNLLNFVESGKFTRLNPTTATALDEHLNKCLDSKGGEMSAKEFRNAVLGRKSNITDFNHKDLAFETKKPSFFDKIFNKEPLEVIKISEVEKKFAKDSELLDRIKAMAKLQPEIVGEAVLTKQQLIDAINKCEINDPEFLKKMFEDFTGKASSDPFKYVSNSKLYKLKARMEDYVEAILKQAKGGKVDKDLLKKMKNKNITYNGINFAAGFIVAAAFLSTFIPKIQYYITRKTTGVDAFPGTYDFEHHHEIRA